MSYSRFWVLLNKVPGGNGKEFKESLVMKYTNGRSKSLKEMKKKEYAQMINDLDELTGEKERRKQMFSSLRRERSNLLHQMQKMGIDTSDWITVDRFCLNPRIAGKKFKDLSQEELIELRVKLYAISSKK